MRGWGGKLIRPADAGQQNTRREEERRANRGDRSQRAPLLHRLLDRRHLLQQLGLGVGLLAVALLAAVLAAALAGGRRRGRGRRRRRAGPLSRRDELLEVLAQREAPAQQLLELGAPEDLQVGQQRPDLAVGRGVRARRRRERRERARRRRARARGLGGGGAVERERGHAAEHLDGVGSEHERRRAGRAVRRREPVLVALAVALLLDLLA